MERPRPYAFGAFTLDLARGVLECDGRPVELSSRGFDILLVLVEARDRVVTRHEILTRVWGGRIVEESNLSVQVSKLRRALGDDENGVIATIPGQGYRFVARITELAPAAEPAPPAAPSPVPTPAPPGRTARAPRRALLPALLALLLLASLGAGWVVFRHRAPPRLSIVVMPFHDLSDHPNHQYLADAISDDITTDLAHLPGSLVVARETADSYAGRAVPAPAVGRALGVRYLLEGSLRAEDANLHINVQLIDTLGGGHLWSERFDITRAGLADARARIVGHIAGGLSQALDRVEAARTGQEGRRDPDAVDLLFRARSRLDHDDTLAGYEAATAFLRKAVALRPDFAEAQAALALALLHKMRGTDDPEAEPDEREARAAVGRALHLAPDGDTALVALAELQVSDGHFSEAADTARQVLARNANDVDAIDVLAAATANEGDVAAAADALGEITRLDPEEHRRRIRDLRLGTFRLLQGRLGDAQAALRRAIAGEPDPEPGAPDWGPPEEARLMLIAAACLDGHADVARTMYAAYARVWPHRTTWRIAAQAARSMAALPGFVRMIAALHDAGMPAFADEHVDDGVPPSATMLPDTSFGATPSRLPGAATIDTAALADLLRAKRADLVLDLGPGVAVLPDAAWEGDDRNADDAQFEDSRLAALRPGGHAATIVVMSDGTYGTVSYNAALRLVQIGYTRVVWYRGGEEAWSAAKNPSLDRRP